MLQIHEQIKNERLKRRLTEDEVAGKLNITRTTYQYWEKKTPSVDKVKRVAKALGLPEDYFFGKKDEDEAPAQIPTEVAAAQILANLKEIREYARVIIAEQQAGQYYILSSLERLEGRQPGELSDLADKLAARLQEKLTFARKSISENDSRISS